jgi:transcriptional regulator GlxA family with amidase domain
MEDFGKKIANPLFSEALFDALPDVVFFVKDAEARYVAVNQTLVKRCGFKCKSDLLGHTVAELFPQALASNYYEQDVTVLRGREEIHNQLELHLYPDREPGWCLTQKYPLFDQDKHIIGLAGISRDLGMPDQRHPVYQRIALAVRYMHHNYQQPSQIADLTQVSGLSIAQLERYFQKIFSLTPRQMMTKIRLDVATRLLQDVDKSISEIAHECGYQDHSAFSRIFRATTGVTPSEYRGLRFTSRKS